jgi:cbb3-type cytochrome oxidase subunit 3
MSEVFKQFPMINLVLVGQLLFFTIFLGALLWVFRKGSKDFYQQLAELPLDQHKEIP